MTTSPTKPVAARVDIQLMGRPYTVACEAGEEQRLESLAGYVDSKLRALAGSISSATQERLFMLACLMLADEVFDLKSTKRDATGDAVLASHLEAMAQRIDKISQALAD